MRFRRLGHLGVCTALSILALATACASVARIGNLADTACAASFDDGLSSILVEQGEKPEEAAELAARTRRFVLLANLGPRAFEVSASSGTDYTFFVQSKKSGCLLRLYGRQKGFVSYTNNLTYIATRPLPPCACLD